MQTRTIIIGMGEIGTSLFNIFKGYYPVEGVDIVKEKNMRSGSQPMKDCDVMHICVRYDDDFIVNMKQYIHKYKPTVVDVCTTVPPGTTESLYSMACHSTTRGLHPHLETGLRSIRKHIGGPYAEALSNYFSFLGIPCETHERAITTELLHILNNVHYGINLAFSDEASRLCRRYGVDFYDYLKYTEDNNRGYMKLGHPTKVRPILTPPGGKIGGHCVVASANLIPDENMGDLFRIISRYNEKK